MKNMESLFLLFVTPQSVVPMKEIIVRMDDKVTGLQGQIPNAYRVN